MFEGILNLYISTLDLFLFPLLALKEILAILIVSTAFTLVSIAISAIAVDRQALKEMKEKISTLQKEIKTAQKRMDGELVNRLTKNTIEINFQMLKLRSKSIVLTFVILAPFFPWLNHQYGGIAVAKLPINLPVIGSSIGWIPWYLLVSISVNYVVKKLLGIEYV